MIGQADQWPDPVTGTVHVVVPDGIDDGRRPSGGNTYDRRVCAGLAELGWSVVEHPAPGAWPSPDAAARTALARLIEGIADGAVVLFDGLIASAVPDVLVPEAARLRLVVLVHMPLGAPVAGRIGHLVRTAAHSPSGHGAAQEAATDEQSVLMAARAVITTSEWTRSWLLDRYMLTPNAIHVAVPGAEPAAPAPGTTAGGALLCVAAVTANKGHDVLLSALAMVSELAWHCEVVGSLDRDPAFASGLGRQAAHAGISARVRFTGAHTGGDLDAAYASADVLVLASRAETYGMVLTEALAHAIPVIATAVGGVPEAVGRAPNGDRPGVLVPPDDPAALAGALRGWLTDPARRVRLRHAALARRAQLTGWSTTAARISTVLAGGAG